MEKESWERGWVKADEPKGESNIIDISFQFSASEVFNISTLVSKLFISFVADGDVWTLGIFPGPIDILHPYVLVSEFRKLTQRTCFKQ